MASGSGRAAKEILRESGILWCDRKAMRNPRRHQRGIYFGLTLLFISSICGCTLLNSGRDLRELPDRDAALRDSLINAENADTQAVDNETSDETVQDEEAPEAAFGREAVLGPLAWPIQAARSVDASTGARVGLVA